MASSPTTRGPRARRPSRPTCSSRTSPARSARCRSSSSWPTTEYNQPGGYSYHHCAELQITADPAKPLDAAWPAPTTNR
ncbi:MAG: hypothetical protein R2712_31385 [Vicinamibacterales bacterium]